MQFAGSSFLINFGVNNMFKTKFGSLAISLSLLTLPVIPSFVAAADEVEEVVAVGTEEMLDQWEILLLQ